MHGSSRSWAGDALAGSLVTWAVLLAVVVVVVAAWLGVKACELVVRMLIAHPDNAALWSAVVFVIGSASVVALTNGASATIDVLAVSSPLLLVAMAKVVELHHDQLLQRHLSRETVLDALHEPWWQAT